jgi:hypothetical protein
MSWRIQLERHTPCDNESPYRVLPIGGATKKPQVLAACPSFASPTLERVLARDVDLTYVNTLHVAESLLRQRADFAMIICAVYFDESRMFDLLHLARTDFPELPFLCVRVFDSDVSRVAGHAIAIATGTLGAVDYVDLIDLARAHGREFAEQRLRDAVFAHLQLRAPMSASAQKP